MYSLLKSTRYLLKIEHSAFSTNATLNLHHQLRDSFERRSLIHGKRCDIQVLSSTNLENTKAGHKIYEQAQDQFMENARQNLFKHFRMNVSLRAMKRGDGDLSDHFSLSRTILRT